MGGKDSKLKEARTQKAWNATLGRETLLYR